MVFFLHVITKIVSVNVYNYPFLSSTLLPFLTYNTTSNLQLKLVIIKYKGYVNLVAALVSVPAVV
jgi:hypothetical protein